METVTSKNVNELYSSPITIRITEWRLVRWTKHVNCAVYMRNFYEASVVRFKRRRHFIRTDVIGRKLLKVIF
jgi:hypothetical protein